MSSRTRRFRGFAALDRPDGALIWGTFRPTEAEARAAYHRHNPGIEGHPAPGVIVPVEINAEKSPEKPIESD